MTLPFFSPKCSSSFFPLSHPHKKKLKKYLFIYFLLINSPFGAVAILTNKQIELLFIPKNTITPSRKIFN